VSQYRPFIVGVDPGKHTGIGVLRRATSTHKEKVLTWTTRDFHSVQKYLATVFADRSEVKVFVEHPPAFVYGRNAGKQGGERDRFQADVGGVRREAKLLFEMLLHEGWDVELVAPVREKKWDAQRFRLFTGSANPANEHERDAVRLAVYYANKR
jgi:hypothetical protein